LRRIRYRSEDTIQKFCDAYQGKNLTEGRVSQLVEHDGKMYCIVSYRGGGDELECIGYVAHDARSDIGAMVRFCTDTPEQKTRPGHETGYHGRVCTHKGGQIVLCGPAVRFRTKSATMPNPDVDANQPGIAWGVKSIETRDWLPGRWELAPDDVLAIHASKSSPPPCFYLPVSFRQEWGLDVIEARLETRGGAS
jgi:hypothetical protein